MSFPGDWLDIMDAIAADLGVTRVHFFQHYVARGVALDYELPEALIPALEHAEKDQTGVWRAPKVHYSKDMVRSYCGTGRHTLEGDPAGDLRYAGLRTWKRREVGRGRPVQLTPLAVDVTCEQCLRLLEAKKG